MLDFASTGVFAILSFIVVISVVVTLHELGHFWAARMFKIRVDTFSIGFGPTLFSRFDKSGVEWRIAAIPLGGYVKFAGDDNAASVPDQETLNAIRDEIETAEGKAAVSDFFHFKPVWQRAIVTAAGPAMNFALTIAIFSALFMGFGREVVAPKVAVVMPNSAAAAGGLRAGDMIISADGRRIDSFQDLRMYVSLRANDPIRLIVERDGREMPLNVTPTRAMEKDITGVMSPVGKLGVEVASDAEVYRVERYNPFEAIGAGTAHTFDILGGTLYYLGKVITGRESADQLGGPVGIARAAGAVSQQAASVDGGFGLKAANVALQLIQLIAVISVGIGFLNLLPIPVLDGGHLVFYAYEAAAGRPLDARIQTAGFQVGLALLVGLMLFVTWNDLSKLPLFQHIGGLFS